MSIQKLSPLLRGKALQSPRRVKQKTMALRESPKLNTSNSSRCSIDESIYFPKLKICDTPQFEYYTESDSNVGKIRSPYQEMLRSPIRGVTAVDQKLAFTPEPKLGHSPKNKENTAEKRYRGRETPDRRSSPRLSPRHTVLSLNNNKTSLTHNNNDAAADVDDILRTSSDDESKNDEEVIQGNSPRRSPRLNPTASSVMEKLPSSRQTPTKSRNAYNSQHNIVLDSNATRTRCSPKSSTSIVEEEEQNCGLLESIPNKKESIPNKINNKSKKSSNASKLGKSNVRKLDKSNADETEKSNVGKLEKSNASKLGNNKTNTNHSNKTMTNSKSTSARKTKSRSIEVQTGKSALQKGQNRKRANATSTMRQTVMNHSTRLTRSRTTGASDEPLGVFMEKLNLSLKRHQGVLDETQLFTLSNNENSAEIDSDLQQELPAKSNIHAGKIKSNNKSGSIQSSVEVDFFLHQELLTKPSIRANKTHGEETEESEREQSYSVNEVSSTSVNKKKRRKRITLNLPSRKNTSKNTKKRTIGESINHTATPNHTIVDEENRNPASKQGSSKRKKGSTSVTRNDSDNVKKINTRSRKSNQRIRNAKDSNSFVTEADFKKFDRMIAEEEIEDDYEPTGWVGFGGALEQEQRKCRRRNMEIINSKSKDSKSFIENENPDLQPVKRRKVMVKVKVANQLEERDIFQSVTDIKWIVPTKTTGSGMAFHKYTSSNVFTSGQVKIEAGGEKGRQKSNKFSQFLVLKGNVVATINDTSLDVISGDIFDVPSGVKYNIQNFEDYEARLHFLQLEDGTQ